MAEEIGQREKFYTKSSSGYIEAFTGSRKDCH
jgi:hypothetical protein